MESHVALNTLDYIVLGIVLFSGLLALMRGFVREVLSLAGWIGAYYIAAKYSPHAEPFVHKYIHSSAAVTMGAAVITFVGALVVFSILGFFTAKVIRGRALTAIDRSLGFVFGVLRGGLVVCIVYMAVTAVLWPNVEHPDEVKIEKTADGKEVVIDPKDEAPKWLTNARTFVAMKHGAGVLRSFLPEKTIEKVNKEYNDQKENMQRTIDDQALEMLSTPAPSTTKKDSGLGYDDKSRDDLDKKVGQ